MFRDQVFFYNNVRVDRITRILNLVILVLSRVFVLSCLQFRSVAFLFIFGENFAFVRRFLFNRMFDDDNLNQKTTANPV